jgi:hypothetical protein
MAGAKQLVTLVFILVPAGGRTSSRGTILRCTVVLVEGATSEAREEVGPPGRVHQTVNRSVF